MPHDTPPVADAAAAAGADAASIPLAGHFDSANAVDSGPADESPMTLAGIFSRIWFTWFSPLMAVGYKRTLEESNLFPMGEKLSARAMDRAFDDAFRVALAAWRAHNPGARQVPWTLTARALFKAFGSSWYDSFFGATGNWTPIYKNDRIAAGMCKFLGDMCGIAIPICIKLVLDVIGQCQFSDTTASAASYCDVALGYTLVGLIFIFQVVSSLLTHAFWHLSMLTGLRVRNALITATFGKALRLSNSACSREFNTGKVVNIVSTDTNRLDLCQPFLHMLWTCPLQVAIAMFIMVFYVGWPALLGIAFLILFVPVQSRAMALVGQLRRKSQSITDKRIKLINELLQGIKVVKLLAWEIPFLSTIRDQRERELYYVIRVAVLKAAIIGVAIAAPATAAIIVFSVYAALPDHTLMPSVIFGSLSLLNLTRMPLWQIPQSYGFAVDAVVSIRRITALLVADEVEAMPTVVDSGELGVAAISVHDASFVWDSSAHDTDVTTAKRGGDEGDESMSLVPAATTQQRKSGTDTDGDDDQDGDVVDIPPAPLPYISDLNLTINKGELVAVVGKVGAGKSSLLSALVGEMQRVAGEVVFDGSVAYCPQVPWIQNARLRDNVLFGATYDPKRYGEAIYLSALQKDLERLPGGDQIEIGERGINLSGGQKARTNLARAIYSGSSIYLLDDILAAVDAHVAAFLFHACIKGHLRNTTRVMVTHSLAYAAQCDRVLVMADGKVAESGTVDELMALGGVGAALFAEYASGKDGGAREDAGDADLVTEIAGDVKDWDYNGEAQRDPGQPASDATNTNARLIKAEERERGAVRLEHYYHYAMYAGGLLSVSMILF
ncbi:hypothetical protein BC828DRAFT_356519, partial [Blastocladiella britannica]